MFCRRFIWRNFRCITDNRYVQSAAAYKIRVIAMLVMAFMPLAGKPFIALPKAPGKLISFFRQNFP
jgi:hypothetical protein